MSLIDGFSPCMDLGTNGCVVWWEAWAVGASVGALAVAFLTMLLTGASAVAVFMLGNQANRLATMAHQMQRDNASAREREVQKEQAREEAVVLAYCGTELDSLTIKLAGIVGVMKPGGAIDLKNFTNSRPVRETLAETAEALPTARMERVLPRLHAMPSGNGVKLANLLGICQNLGPRCRDHATFGDAPGDTPEEVAKNTIEHFETCHGNRLSEATTALGIARELSRLSYHLIHIKEDG